MTKLWHDSLLYRLLAWIAVWLADGPFGRFHRRLTALRRQSLTHCLLMRLLRRDDPAAQSGLRAALDRFHASVYRHADGLAARWKESMLYRLCRALFLRLHESVLLGWLFASGVTGAILYVVGVYGLIDYLLRDVLPLPVFSSVWDELFLLFGLFWIALTRITARKPVRSRLNSVDLSVSTFLLVGAALLFCVHPFPQVAIAGYRATMQYLLWFYIITRLLRNDHDVSLLVHTLVAAATLIALHGIYQYIIAVPIPASWTDASEGAVRTRVFSIFGSPNIMGDFLVLFAPITVGLAYSARDNRKKLLFWVCALCMCLSCLFTMSRGAWVGLVVAVVVFSLLVDRRLLLLMLLAGVVSLFLPFVASRLGYLFSPEYAASAARGGRSVRWEQALAYLHRENKWLGVGFGMFGGAIAMQFKPLASINYFYVDNYYMKILTENGYLGLIFFVGMMAILLFCGAKACIRRKRGTRAPLPAGILAGLCGVLTHCFFENIFEEPYMMVYFWVCAGILIYLGFLREEAN